MNSTPAPTPDPLPVARDGVPPVPSAVAGLDWSADAATAMVGRLVHQLAAADRLVAEAVESLIRVIEIGATEATLGVAVELVLSQTCRAAGFERRTLLTVATTLGRMPSTRQAFVEAWISWSQVRAVVTAVGRVDAAGRAKVDDLVAELAPNYVDMEADALVFEVDWLVDQLVEAARTERDARPIEHNRTIVMPRLDGSGTLLSEYDADHFTPMVQRMDHHAVDRFPLDATPDPADPDTDDVALSDARRHAVRLGRRNAVRRGLALFELVTGWDAETLTPLDPDDTARASGRPSLLVTCSLDTLLDGTVPGWILTGLAGRIQATSDTIHRWVDAHGADCRLVVLDDVGEVVGVGRRQRFADGWLRDAIIARDLHDTAPCSTTPAMHCHVDHVTDWEAGGRTDVDNLGLLSARWNQAKGRRDWTLKRHPDGSRTWTAASGYSIRQPRRPHLRRITDDRSPTDGSIPPDPGPSP